MLSGFPPVRGPVQLVGRLGLAGVLEFARLVLMSAETVASEIFHGQEAAAWLFGAAMHGDVPPDTVVWITVTPRAKPRLSDLAINESTFKKTQGGHIQGLTYYTDEKTGLTLEVYEGTVQAFLYGPTQIDKHLQCPRSAVFR